MTPPDRLIPDARAFLGELKNNNSRDWFTAQKARYDADLKAPALALLDQVAADLERQTGDKVETKLFRPHRDVRFSKDKTPYHEHLHMLWTTPGMAWFFGISPDYISAGGGRMGMQKETLDAFRARVDAAGDGLQAELDALAAEGFRIGEPDLKRVPRPYDADHPHGALLRRKSMTAWMDFDQAPPDPAKAVSAVFARLLPLRAWLAEV